MPQTDNSAVHNARIEQASGTDIMDQQFDILCGQYYHAWFRYHPEQAVDVGVYDFAGQLRSYEHDDIGALIALDQKMQSALDELDSSALDAARKVDYRIIKGAILVELHDLEESDWRYRDPLEYVPVNAIYQLLIHPDSNVHQAIKHRLELIPEYLRGAKVMLSRYPERVVSQWAITAKDIAYTGVEFIRGLGRHPLMTSKFSNPARLQPLLDAAANALNDYARFIEIEVVPLAEGKFASGYNRFDRLINEKHYLETDAEKILAFGECLAARTESELLLQSKKICGDEDIRRALDIVRADHPDASQLLDSYRKKMQAAHTWLLQADIVTVPGRQSLKVQQTPDFLREVIPFAAYEPPMPQDEEQRGLYYVTTVSDESLLAEHNQYSMDLTSVHEAFPGHHLQFVVANRNNASVTRLLNASASMYEGWALYCEQLVFEQGLYDKEEHEFILLRDRLWRALRIIIDVKMHTGHLSFEDAAELLVSKLGFDIAHATSEINWYSHEAATPLCYAIGREIILKTREIVAPSEKEKLKEFHDALLSQGSIALPLVVKAVFGESVWQRVHDSIFSRES
ncbi:MAG TPA: DUF885 domain-containing protein [Gammaproteobacteria bacterium]|nr:DUF885 domain-containing protein [Gammaproteobacteria bacterium]